MSLPVDMDPDEVEAFLQDTDDQLLVLNQSVVRLESEADNQELLQAVFRAAHTLKGNAGLIHHERMARLTHALETVLDRVRKGALSVTPELVDVILGCIDLLEALKQEVVTRSESGVDVVGAIDWLQAYQGAKGEGPAQATKKLDLTIDEETQVRLTNNSSLSALHVVATIEERSIAPAVRIYQMITALAKLAEIIRCCPTLEDVERETEARVFEALALTTSDPKVVQSTLEDISDIESVQVEAIGASRPAAGAFRKVAPNSVQTPDLKADSRVRISIEQLDHLMNLAGELVVSRTHLAQVEADIRQSNDAQGTQNELLLRDVTTQMGRLIDQLAEEVMRARMVPVGPLFAKFPRLVRDVSRSLNKQVELVIEGQDTELDRSIIETIGDPLIHLLRNAVDHGLETLEERERVGKPPKGTVVLSASQREGYIVITVADDGHGIDPDNMRRTAVSKGMLNEEAAASLSDQEAIDLIFLSGVSTAEKVTNLSGRGVGMDIVRTSIERLNGSVDVRSQVGLGTTVEITLPLTMAIVPSMLVSVGEGIYAVPLSLVADVHRMRDVTVQTIRGREAVVLRNELLPLFRLRNLLALGDGRPSKNDGYIVVLRWGRMSAGVVVDGLIGSQDVVIKSLGPLTGNWRGLAGGSILGSGKIALILDVPELFRFAARRQDRLMREAS